MFRCERRMRLVYMYIAPRATIWTFRFDTRCTVSFLWRQCRVSGSHVSVGSSGQSHVTCDAQNGLRCYNREQSTGSCEDYEVRVLCWSPGCTGVPPTLSTTVDGNLPDIKPTREHMFKLQLLLSCLHGLKGSVYTRRFQTQASWAGKPAKWTGPSMAQPARPWLVIISWRIEDILLLFSLLVFFCCTVVHVFVHTPTNKKQRKCCSESKNKLTLFCGVCRVCFLSGVSWVVLSVLVLLLLYVRRQNVHHCAFCLYFF